MKNSREWYLAEAVVELASKYRICICDSEKSWKAIACSLANCLADEGLYFFLELSKQRQHFSEEDTAALYRSCQTMKSRIGFGTFMYYAHQNGIKRCDYLITCGDDYVMLPFN